MILAGLAWWLEGGSVEERLKGDGQSGDTEYGWPGVEALV